MTIRPYTKEDLKEIVRVINSILTEECWPHYYPNKWDEERVRSEFRPMNGYKDPMFLVSEADGQITGLIAGHDLDSFIETEIPHLRPRINEFGLCGSRAFYQRDIIIDPANQRGFLGLRLFLDLRKHASETGYKKLVTRTPPLNSRGIRFFTKLGYVKLFEDANPERVYFVMDMAGRHPNR